MEKNLITLKKLLSSNDYTSAGRLLKELEPTLPKQLYIKYSKLISARSNRRNTSSTVHAGIASIPSRVDALRSVVDSILPQVDCLHIYLNDFGEPPEWILGLNGVRAYTSDTYGLIGDAGKFFPFISGNASSCEYYLTIDDDILYPPDYVMTLLSKHKLYECPVGVHGSLVKDGSLGYYTLSNRYVFHFRDELASDTRVHLLGTGTALFSKKDLRGMNYIFLYPNMADIWIAKYFSERSIPLIAVSRVFDWLKPIETDRSIWTANKNAETLQAHIVNSELMSIFRNNLRARHPLKKKILIGIKTYNRVGYLAECIDSLVSTIETDIYDVSIVVSDGGSTDGTIDYLEALRIPVEFVLIKHERAYVSRQFNAILDHFLRVDADFLVCIDDDVLFRKTGWLLAYYQAAMDTGYHHLCHFNHDHYQQLLSKSSDMYRLKRITCDGLESFSSVYNCMGALFTITKSVVDKVGYADEVNFYARGKWHIDYSVRCCRAGFNEMCRFWDIKSSGEFIELQNTAKGDSSYQTSISWDCEEFRKCSSKEEVERRVLLCADPTRRYIASGASSMRTPLIDRSQINTNRLQYFREFMSNICVINLDRRSDRWRAIDLRLKALGLESRRFSAFDGRDQSLKDEYAAYTARLEQMLSDMDKKYDAQAFFSKDIYSRGLSERVRAYAFCKMNNKIPIQGPGALAYIKSYQSVLLDFVSSSLDRVCILDDDCMFHYDMIRIGVDGFQALPLAWKACLLGTMQYNWDLTSGYSNVLYRPNGAIVASHATIYSRSGACAMLALIEESMLPLDVGALSALSQKYPSDVYVFTPNLSIQAQCDSDISEKDAAKLEKARNEEIFGWNRSIYF